MSDLETLYERVKEALRLGAEAGLAEVTLELRDAFTILTVAEGRDQ